MAGLSVIQKCNPDAILLAHENTMCRISKGSNVSFCFYFDNVLGDSLKTCTISSLVFVNIYATRNLAIDVHTDIKCILLYVMKFIQILIE